MLAARMIAAPNIKHSAKLLGLYERQLGALDKHRGKGQQKITVEHVNVHAGGQAIVGHVEAGAKPSEPPPGQAALADQGPRMADPLEQLNHGERLPRPGKRSARARQTKKDGPKS